MMQSGGVAGTARPALMTVFRNEGKWDTSNVEFRGGRIVAYDKRQRTSEMRHIDYGLSVLTPRAFAGLESKTPLDLAEVFQKLVAMEELAGYEVDERFYEGPAQPLKPGRTRSPTRWHP